MKNQIKSLLISIFMLTICMPEAEKKKEFDNSRTIIELDPDTKDWNNEIKKIKDPELRKLLKELNIEFNNEKDYLKKEFKKKLEALRKEYLEKRQKLKKKYKKRKRNKKKK